jgi:hypothetical protein
MHELLRCFRGRVMSETSTTGANHHSPASGLLTQATLRAICPQN